MRAVVLIAAAAVSGCAGTSLPYVPSADPPNVTYPRDSPLYDFHDDAKRSTLYAPIGALSFNDRGTLLGVTTRQAGCPNCTGAVYEFSRSRLSVIHRFVVGRTGNDGLFPTTGVVTADGGKTFYGSTEGSNLPHCVRGCGTLYELTAGTSGYRYRLVHVFSPQMTEGSEPQELTADPQTKVIYGAGEFGGDLRCGGGTGCGVVFTFTNAMGLKVLYRFANGREDGAFPVGKLVVDAKSGAIFGTTLSGGTPACPVTPSYRAGCGTIFELVPNASHDGYAERVLHYFGGLAARDGGEPTTGLVRSGDGSFYGTTSAGGNAAACYSNAGCGVVFLLRPRNDGAYDERVLYDFGVSRNGSPLLSSRLVASRGRLYGTTLYGGKCPRGRYDAFANGCGSIFSVDERSGATHFIYDFRGPRSDGALPSAELAADTNGVLYGVTSQGGTGRCPEDEGCGTIFSFEPGRSKSDDAGASLAPLAEPPRAARGGGSFVLCDLCAPAAALRRRRTRALGPAALRHPRDDRLAALAASRSSGNAGARHARNGIAA
jgi:hypothetical protein